MKSYMHSLFLSCIRLSSNQMAVWNNRIIQTIRGESTVIETVVCDSESCGKESNYSGAHFPYSSELTIRFDQRETTKTNDWLNNKESSINGFIYKEWPSKNLFDDLYAQYRCHIDIILPI